MQFSQALTFIKRFQKTSNFRLIQKLFYLSVLFLLIYQVAEANDEKNSPQQWKLCWQLPNSEFNAIETSAARSGLLFLSTTGGKLLALNIVNGETLWRSELGGEIIGQIQTDKNFVYITSQIAATNENQAKIVIRALSIETGLTVWQGELSAASQVVMALSGNYLLIGTGDLKASGKVIALSADKGQLRWTQMQNAQLSTLLTINNDLLIFATSDKTLHFLKIDTGQETRSYKLPQAAQEKIILSKNELIFGDPTGNIFAINQNDGKTVWKLRLGAAAQNILTSANGVLIASLDDFVYFQNASTGKRIWRKRLSSRPLGIILLSETTALLVTTGENNVTVLTLKKGEVINQLLLGNENVPLAAPLTSENFIFVPTVNGLLAFAPTTTVCPNK